MLNFHRSKDDKRKYAVELIAGGVARFIGTLDTHGTGTFSTNRDESQIFRLYNAIGVNCELLDGGKFKYVVVRYGGRLLQQTREFVVTHGIRKTWGKWEPQYFLPIADWKVMGAVAREDNADQLSLEL